MAMLAMCASAMIVNSAAAQAVGVQAEAAAPQEQQKIQKTETWQIVSDSTENGVRHVKAVPAKNVCSQSFEFDIKDGCMHNLKYTGGCNGNLKAIGRLTEGMKVSMAISLLDGVECGKRGTSCTDQLAKVLKSLNIGE